MTVLIAFAVGVALIHALLAARAWTVARRGGLVADRSRLYAAGFSVALACFFLVLSQAPLPPLAVPDAPTDPEILAKLADLDARAAKMQTDLDGVRAEIEVLRPSADASMRIWVLQAQSFALMMVPILLVGGVFVSLLLDDPRSLIPKRFRRRDPDTADADERAEAGLGGVIAACERGAYWEALRAALEVNADRLEDLERVELVWMRNLARAMLLGKPEELPEEERTARAREAMMADALRELEMLAEWAPRNGEVNYLHAYVLMQAQKDEDALSAFATARPLLAKGASKAELPWDVLESVCLLRQADTKVRAADMDGAQPLLDGVVARKVLADRVPGFWARYAARQAQQAMKEGRRDEAALAIERLRQLTGLEAEASTRLMAVSDALEVVLASKDANPEALLSALDAFLAKHQPALPPLDEDLVDELLEAPMSAKSLPLPPEVFAAVHFLRARALATVLGLRRRPLTELAPLREPLLRALQFRIQHREVLGVLGALWFWFVPEQRREGVRLLERASRLGSPSLIVARLLQVEQETEATRRDLLEWFRSASIRVLRDPTLSAGVREALVRDLAQFREHQPLLLELEEGGATTLRDPTLPELIGRSRHVSRMADHVTAARGDATRLRALGDEHGRLLGSLATAVARLQELEREVVGEAGRTLISGSEP